MTNRPLVSIITPSFNQGRFIGDCIASVQRQTYTAVEHVIRDGGSTDETGDVLEAAPANVCWASEADRGQAHALNKAFSSSRGDIVGWLNSDDAYFDRRAIEDAVRVLEHRPEVDLVYGHAALVGADNELLHFMWAPPFSARLFLYWNFIVQPTVFVRREVIRDELVDERLDFVVDRELWLRLLSQGCRFERLDRIVAIDRHHGERKGLTMLSVGQREDDELLTSYGVPLGVRRRVVPKACRVATRIWGARLLSRTDTPTAIDVRYAPKRTLIRRQIMQRRRHMPLLFGADDRR